MQRNVGSTSQDGSERRTLRSLPSDWYERYQPPLPVEAPSPEPAPPVQRGLLASAGKYVSDQAKFVANNPVKAAKNVGNVLIDNVNKAGENIAAPLTAGVYEKSNEEIRRKEQEIDKKILEDIRNTSDPKKKKRLGELLLNPSNAVDAFSEVPALNKTKLQMAADFAGLGLDIATLGTGGQALKQGGKALAGQGLKRTVASAAAEGFGYGATGALQSGSTDAKEIAKQGAIGAAVGGAVPVVGAGIKSATGIGNKGVREITGDSATDTYLKAMKDAQIPEKKGIAKKTDEFYRSFKEKWIDSLSPIEDTIAEAEKKHGFKLLPTQDFRYQADKVLRSSSQADQFAKDFGLEKIIQEVDDVGDFEQYLIARYAPQLEKRGIVTGRDLVKDEKIVKALEGKYSKYADQFTEYNKKMIDYQQESGLISKELADELKKNPEYVPFNRVFGEEELASRKAPAGAGRGTASQSGQSTVKKIEGSERAVDSPMISSMTNTLNMFREGERNRAANMLISYESLPDNPLKLRKLDPGETIDGKSVISAMVDGKKVTYETTPQIAAAAKSLNAEDIGLVGSILNAPVRVLRLGATGVNPAFIAANLVKDQTSAFINSRKATKTSILNPMNFVGSAMEALGHGEVYQQMVRDGAYGTSFDVGRKQVAKSVAKTRAGRNAASNIAFTAKSPKQLLRAIEDTVSRSEELTRIQLYKGTYDALIKEGRTVADARILAADQARRGTVNFARAGTYGRVINQVVPYFNAGIQGSRNLTSSIRRDPVGTGAKIATTVFLPIAAATTWNISDPERKAAYDDINDFEKENNIIIVPPNPTKNEDGRWNVIKIPLSPDIAGLGGIVRQALEAAEGYDPQSFGSIAANLFKSGTSVDLTNGSRSLVSSYTPQGAKPFIESSLNKNLFTGNPIVPDDQIDLPTNEQVGKNTSGTAKVLGGIANISPRKIDNFISTSAGGVGRNLVNASDTALASAGVIGREDVRGQSVPNSISSRFASASGGKEIDEFYNVYTPNRRERDKVSAQVTELMKQGKTNEAKRKAEEYNATIESRFSKYIERYGEITDQDLKDRLDSLEIKTSNQALNSRKSTKK